MVGEASKVDGGIQAGKLRVVERVEGIRAQLQTHPLLHPELLLQRDIVIHETWILNVAVGRVNPDAAHRRGREGRRIDPVIRAAGSSHQRIADQRDAGGFGVGSGELRAADAGDAEADSAPPACLRAGDAGNLPAVEGCFHQRVLVAQHPAEGRHIVDIVDGQKLPAVEAGRTIIGEAG